MQFSVMYVKMMGVKQWQRCSSYCNHQMSGTEVVHVSVLACVFSADPKLSEDGYYTTTKGSVCHMACQIFKCIKYPAAFRRQYIRHVPSHRDIVKWYNMFLENELQMPHTGGRRRDRKNEEDIRQGMMQSPQKSLSPYQQSRIHHT